MIWPHLKADVMRNFDVRRRRQVDDRRPTIDFVTSVFRATILPFIIFVPQFCDVSFS
jgi:hypothetical protein